MEKKIKFLTFTFFINFSNKYFNKKYPTIIFEFKKDV